jgi:hypothetical protein
VRVRRRVRVRRCVRVKRRVIVSRPSTFASLCAKTMNGSDERKVLGSHTGSPRKGLKM